MELEEDDVSHLTEINVDSIKEMLKQSVRRIHRYLINIYACMHTGITVKKHKDANNMICTWRYNR